MTDDYIPKIVSMQHVPSFGPGAIPRTVTRVQIMVGALGPFIHDFPEGMDRSDDINAWINETVNKLRMLPATT